MELNSIYYNQDSTAFIQYIYGTFHGKRANIKQTHAFKDGEEIRSVSQAVRVRPKMKIDEMIKNKKKFKAG